jgi:hypothetical protein
MFFIVVEILYNKVRVLFYIFILRKISYSHVELPPEDVYYIVLKGKNAGKDVMC